MRLADKSATKLVTNLVSAALALRGAAECINRKYVHTVVLNPLLKNKIRGETLKGATARRGNF